MEVITVYGLEAIATHNGWAMAATGALIVFFGLVLLSTTISQLYRIIDLFDKKTLQPEAAVMAAQAPPKSAEPSSYALDLEADLFQYQAASTPLGDSFDLADLYQVARELDLAHPHLSISHFRRQNMLVVQPSGQFSWNK
jgi:hypothetical protein